MYTEVYLEMIRILSKVRKQMSWMSWKSVYNMFCYNSNFKVLR